ncbi:MAG: DUF423 domain-containing protein [Motiliproteus sp.]
MTSIKPQWILFSGAISSALAVALGAFGAHAMEDLLSPERMQTWETASRYLMYHALAVLVMGIALIEKPRMRVLQRAAIVLILGASVFSGSLYILCLTELIWLAWLTPVGGLILLSGWSYLAFAALRWRALA